MAPTVRARGGRGRSTPASGCSTAGFDALSFGYGWLAARVVRVALVVLVAYVAILGYGLNEFRKTPAGFIPQQDAGYLIGVTQLPAGAALARTDEVNRRVVETALQVPGVAHAVNIVGFSGATFTNAPEFGRGVRRARSVRGTRKGSEEVSRRYSGRVVPAPRRHPGGLRAGGGTRRRCAASATPAACA